MTLNTSTSLLLLDRLGTIVVTGFDAKSFLQGQLSFDMDRLSPARAEITTCNSAQGRVQAVVWLIERSDSIVMVLPASMVDAAVVRLRKYVLRAKAKIESGAGRFTVAAANDSFDAPPQTHSEVDGRSYIRWPGQGSRTLCLVEPDATGTRDATAALEWHRVDIEAGLPQVYPQTHEAFVAQMLNVDLLGGIGFEKGCYTGQEIIARTHFRGAIKRRMFRFYADTAAPEPGTRVLVGDQHAGDVVDAVTTSSGCELLAVIALTQAEAQLELDASNAKLDRLALPYSLTTSPG
jgi:folate-binding protein YgfZ